MHRMWLLQTKAKARLPNDVILNMKSNLPQARWTVAQLGIVTGAQPVDIVIAVKSSQPLPTSVRDEISMAISKLDRVIKREVNHDD